MHARRSVVVIGATLLSAGLSVGLWTANASVALDRAPKIIHITAQRFRYSPAHLVLKKGVPVILELTSADRLHGFDIPALGVRADIVPGQTVRVRVVPNKVGRFAFHCDNYCGTGHEDMSGMIVVRN